MAVTNPYYEFAPEFTPGTKARSDAVNLQYQAIQNAFDLLPGEADAISTGTAAFAPESGSGNAYAVTMPSTRTSNQDGDHIVFFATHTNTGATTMAVDALGPVAMVNWDGDAFTGGEIVSGRLYTVRYDATNTQFVLEATVDNALQVGYAQEWATQAEDVLISTAAGGDGLTDYSAYHWAQKSLAGAVTGRVNTDISTATPPTNEGVTGAFEIWDQADDDLLARIGFASANDLQIQNTMHGGFVRITAENAAGSELPLFYGHPDSETYIYRQGSLKIAAESTGMGTFGSVAASDPPTTEAVDTTLNLWDANGVAILGEIGYSGNHDLVIQNRMHAGEVHLAGESSAGVQRTFVKCDQNIVTLYEGGEVRMRTTGDGIEVLGTSTTGTTGTNHTSKITYQDQNGTTLTELGFFGEHFYLQNYNRGGRVIFKSYGDDTFNYNLIVADPDNKVDIYHPTPSTTGELAMSTKTTGLDVYGDTAVASPPTVAANTYIGLWDKDGTDELGLIGFTSSINLKIRNNIHGGPVLLTGEDNSGVEQNLVTGDPDGQTWLYYQGAGKIGSSSNGAALLGSATAADPPTTEPIISMFQFFDSDFTTQLAECGFNAGPNFKIANNYHGGQIRINGETTGGTAVSMIVGDPDGATSLYYAGVLRARTNTSGYVEILSDGSTDAETRAIAFSHANSTDRAYLGHLGSTPFVVRNLIHGGDIILQAEDNAGALHTLATFDPDLVNFQLPGSGSPSAPTLAFGDGDSGIYEVADDFIGFATGTALRMQLGTYLESVTSRSFGMRANAAGTIALPTYSFRNDSDTGMVSTTADQLEFSIGGVEGLRLTEASSGVIQAHMANVGLTADVGSAQGSGVITASYNVYSTVATAGDAATLPSTFAVGTMIYVKNDGANDMDVFPASGDDAGAGLNTAVVVAAGESVTFIATVADSTWTSMIVGGGGLPDGTIEGGTLRWDNTAGEWVENTRVQIDSSGALYVYDDIGGTDSIKIWHSGTDATFDFTSTTDLEFDGFSGAMRLRGTGGGLVIYDDDDSHELSFVTNNSIATITATAALLEFISGGTVRFTDNIQVRSGAFLRLYDSTSNEYMTMENNDTDVEFSFTTTRGLRVNQPIYLAERASAESDTATLGQLWVKSNAPNEFWFTDDTGDDYPVATGRARRLATNAAYNLNTAGNEGYNGVCFYDDNSAYTITLENSSGTTNMPVDTSFQIINGGTGTITVTEGTTTTLNVIEPDGTVTDSAGGCTIPGGSAATVFRSAAGVYYIWGANITP